MTEIIAKRKWRYPLSYERSYAKLLRDYVRRKCKVIQAFLPELQDAVQSPSAVNARIEIVMDGIEKAVENAEMMTTSIQHIFDLVSRYNQTEFDAITKSLFGAPLSGSQPPAGIHQDAEIDDLKEMWVNQNLDLIKSIDQQTLQRLKQAMNEAILNNVDKRLLMKYLVDELQKIAGLEESRAVLIGTDQVGKLNGMLSRYRQENAGIDSYIWETCHDSRVRLSHADRQGHKYKWSSPPPGGHPGMPIRCRCVALPVIDLEKIPIRAKSGSFYKIGNVSQAKKRDHKILITDVAVDKVPCVKTSGMSESEAFSIQGEHKALLKIAQQQNESNEVLTIMSTLNGMRVRTLGTEKTVDPSSNPEAVKLMRTSARNEMAYLHNHPSTNRFSLVDIHTFLVHAQIGTMSVVTNQGEVYVLHKTRKYDYNKAREIFDTICADFLANKLSHNEAVDRFVKEAAKGGIEYGKSR